MKLAHKSVHVQEELWRRLRLNAEISGVAVRDLLSYLLARSEPVPEGNTEDRKLLEKLVRDNETASAGARGNSELIATSAE